MLEKREKNWNWKKTFLLLLFRQNRVAQRWKRKSQAREESRKVFLRSARNFFSYSIWRDCCWSLLFVVEGSRVWCCVCYFIEHIINIISIILWKFRFFNKKFLFVFIQSFRFYIFPRSGCFSAVFQFSIPPAWLFSAPKKTTINIWFHSNSLCQTEEAGRKKSNCVSVRSPSRFKLRFSDASAFPSLYANAHTWSEQYFYRQNHQHWNMTAQSISTRR